MPRYDFICNICEKRFPLFTSYMGFGDKIVYPMYQNKLYCSENCIFRKKILEKIKKLISQKEKIEIEIAKLANQITKN